MNIYGQTEQANALLLPSAWLYIDRPCLATEYADDYAASWLVLQHDGIALPRFSDSVNRWQCLNSKTGTVVRGRHHECGHHLNMQDGRWNSSPTLCTIYIKMQIALVRHKQNLIKTAEMETYWNMDVPSPLVLWGALDGCIVEVYRESRWLPGWRGVGSRCE